MTSKDATEGSSPGSPTERIPPHAKPDDVIPGDPDKVDDLVVKLRAYAGAFKDGNDKLAALSRMAWTGAASQSFTDAIEVLPKELKRARKHFLSAAHALDAYADKLRSVHKRVKPIITDADAARAASKKYVTQSHEYDAAVARKDEDLPDKPPDEDPGVSALSDCYRRLDILEKELQGVVDVSKRKLEQAAEKAPDPPKGMAGVHERGQDFLSGAAESIRGMYKQGEYFVEDGYGGASMQLAGMADGAAYAAQHPKEFAKAVVNWEEWQRNPSRAAGQLTPDLLMALASGGGGALRKGGSAAKNAAQRLVSRERALRRDGSARDRADGPDQSDVGNGERTGESDPVDVVSGEMFTSTTDVALPGDLPLLLERHYVSGHPCGGWFGPTWAGTLDQRVELDERGIVFVADDGMVLSYPVPEAEVPVLPVSGPRWPLCWDGKPDGTMTITAPERNRTLHFAPLPAGGRELALRAISDRAGNRIDIAYDQTGAPQQVTHSGGYRIAVDTDAELMRITALRMLHGPDEERSTLLVSYRYDQAGDLAEIVNSTGQPLRYRYDEAHRITSWKDRNGTAFGYVYDHRGRVLRTIGPDGTFSGRFFYDEAARTTRYTDSLGHQSVYVYNEAHRIVAETDTLGHTTRTEWEADNRHPVAVTDPLGRTTRYTYDEAGNLTRIQRPDGSTTTALYDDDCLPLEIRDPNDGLWQHTYDDQGNRTSTTDPAGNTTRYTYNQAGHLTSVTDPLGHTTTVTPNSAGLPTTLTDPLGNTTHIRRGPHGRVTTLTDPMGHTTRHGWTIEGKPAWRQDPDGNIEKWDWDGEGNLVSHTDAAGHTTAYTHTHFDLPATRTDPDGAEYAFAYDTELRLVEVTNPQDRTWGYEYDPVGRLVAETDFNGATQTYELDAAGGLVAQTNAMGERLTYVRDPLGRPVEQHDETSGEVTTYAYDPAGALVHTANAAADVTLERDVLGRVLSETVNGRTVSYAYDAAGCRISRTTPAGHISTWTYDAADRPLSLTTDGGSLSFTHDAAGRETHRQLTDTVALSQYWDATGALTRQTVEAAHGELLQHRAYAYRPDGYVTEIRELTSGTRRFDLDKMGRVTGVQAHGWTEKYAYDTAGNQSHAEAPAHPSSGERSHDGTLIRRAGRTTYEHDAAGRLIRKTRKLLNGQTRTWTYTWNAEDRLISATNPSGEEWHYSYDPLGRRLTKTGPEERSTSFTWDGTRVAEQTTEDGTTTTWDYEPGTHRPLAQTTRDPLVRTPQFHAIITDTVGTPTELLTPEGSLAWQSRTTLWGTPLPSPTTAVDCPLRFPGQYADPETGLNYNYFRYYDPETARYLTPDPLRLAPSPNPAAYVHNPCTWTDPLGLAPKCLNQTGKTGKDANENFVSGSADGKRLAEKLRRESADSIFNENGWLTPKAIAESRRIIPGGDIQNTQVRKLLTSDGSNLSDWGKYATRVHQSPYGDFQVHYYYNSKTGRVLNHDYKVVMNRRQ
ncbi:RHS repeat-associated core domain-containing protein [Streptomyces qinglanensis]|uniref:RHS repeat-associated core domain-containing protein n=1 Tax=Streptomyces qinglanensis TaxID=943816 RepID=UPI003790816F